MRTTAAFLFVLVIAVAFPVQAHPDDPPSTKLTAADSRGFVLAEFDKVAYVTAEAEDKGFNAGISSIQLFEGARLLDRKECFFTLKCTLRTAVVENTTKARIFKATVIDAGQNKKSATLSVRFLGVERKPSLSFVDDAEVREGNKVSIPVGVYDRNNDNVAVTAKKLPRGSSFANNVFSWTPGFDQSGDYNVLFTATDNDGTAEKSLHIKVIDTNRQPAVNFSDKKQTVTIHEGRRETFAVAINDPDNKQVPVEWKLTKLSSGSSQIVSTSKQYTLKPNFDAAGLYVLSALVKDKTFLTEKSWNISVENVNRKPVLNAIQEKEINVGETLRFYMHGKDDDKDALIFSIKDIPKGAKFDEKRRLFEWKTKEGDEGKYTPVFRVSDGTDADAQTVKITVKKKYLTKHEEYHKFLERVEEEKSKVARITNDNTKKNVTISECRNGYLCSTTTFLF